MWIKKRLIVSAWFPSATDTQLSLSLSFLKFTPRALESLDLQPFLLLDKISVARYEPLCVQRWRRGGERNE